MRPILAAAVLMTAVAGSAARHPAYTTVFAAAQTPVVNAVVERRPAPESIAREVQAIASRGTPAWIGYQVPIATRAAAAPRTSETCCGRCRLEPPTELVVLTRVDAGRIVQLRPIAVDCDIDAAGMPLVWFDAVNPDDSVRWLESLATDRKGQRDTRVANAALLALSRHATVSAITRLIQLAGTDPDHDVRRRAFLYLGESNDPRAVAFLSDVLLK